MKSKKKLIFLSSISVVSIVCTAAFLLANNNISMLDSYKEPYGISFSSTRNKFFPGTGSTDYSGQATVKTNDDNDIQFQYYSIAGGSSSVWHLVKNGGYFYNIDPIHGLESLSISCTAADKEYRISWGKDLNFDLGSYNYLSSTSSVVCNFDNESPTYFKFENISGSNISIKEMSIKLDCYNYYPLVSLNVNNEEMGTVFGDGAKTVGESVTIVASPNSGYNFVGWYNGPTLVSPNTSYTFTIGDEDVSYIAVFTYESYNLIVESESLQKGSVSNSSGNYDYLSEISIEATPNNGYSFVGWHNGESIVSDSNPYTFNMPHNNLSLTATFSTNSYDLSLINGNPSLGTITGDGNFLYGNNVTITATPNTGVAFLGWFDNNDNLVSNLTSYSFIMPYNDLTYTAKFEWVPYAVSLSINDENMGIVSGSGSYQYGQSVTLNAYPFEHHSFFGWYDGDELLSQESSFEFTMPNKSLEYTARFVVNHNLIVYSDNEEMGTVNAPSEWGEGLEVTINGYANEGYSFDYWCDENYDELSYEEEYSFIMPDHDCEVIAVFSNYKETLTLDSNLADGAVTFKGQGRYESGREVTISSEAVEGLIFDGWYTEDYELVSNSNPYTFIFTHKTKLIAYYHYSSFVFTFYDINSKTCSLSGYNGTIEASIYLPKLYEGNVVNDIKSSAFEHCESLVSAVIPNTIISIGSYAFSGCSLSYINIPNSVSSLGMCAFSWCSSLLTVDIPNSVISMGIGTFASCISLTTINIPDSITSIKGSTFLDCTSLASITIGNNVISIEPYAFDNCKLLTSIKIPNSVEQIGRYAFSGCASITIYCEAQSQPADWDSEWNPDNRPVVWGYIPE